jgi:tRNA pseudouridine55 synthase
MTVSAPVKPMVGDGILNVRKEAGWTSHDVVAKVRALLRGPKIGHAGTLDPAATGVLPILVGRATRIAEYLVDWDKEYRAVLRLGEITDTQDATGTVLARHATEHLSADSIGEAVARFQGRLTQVPPMYSAVKVGGVPLYRAARAGRTVEREAREVTIHAIEILGIAGPEVDLRIVCSKGTYIRTLCADIGQALGVGGHLRSLVRTRVGPLMIDRAVTVDAVCEQPLLGRLGEALMTLDAALEPLPALVVETASAARLVHGVPVPCEAVWPEASADRGIPRPGQIVRLKDATGRLLALGRVPEVGEKRLPVIKVLADPFETTQN